MAAPQKSAMSDSDHCRSGRNTILTFTECAAAPSTMLRMVPLSRFAGEDQRRLAILGGRLHRGLAMTRKMKTDLTRRMLLASVAAAGAGVAWIGQSRAQPVGRTPLPHSARERLEEALARIADKAGEG